MDFRCMLSEYAGMGLDQYVIKERGIRQEVMTQLMYQLSCTFRALGKRGMLHNDVRDCNVCIQTKGDRIQVTVIDFGLACSVNQPVSYKSRLDKGTVESLGQWVAPEVLNQLQCSVAADHYSMAVMCTKLILEHNLCYPSDINSWLTRSSSKEPHLRVNVRHLRDMLKKIISSSRLHSKERKPKSEKEISSKKRKHDEDLVENSEGNERKKRKTQEEIASRKRKRDESSEDSERKKRKTQKESSR